MATPYFFKKWMEIFRNMSPSVRLRAESGYGSLATLKFWIRMGGEVNRISSSGDTPLHQAVLSITRDEDGYLERIRLLLDQGAGINIKTQHHQYTPLHMAVQRGSKEAMVLLLARGADPALRDKFGSTPMDFLREKQRQRKGVDVDGLLGILLDFERKELESSISAPLKQTPQRSRI